MLTATIKPMMIKLEKKTGRRITVFYISRHSGINRQTVTRWAKGKSGRLELTTLMNFKAWFEKQGLTVKVSDFFEIR